MANKVFKLIGPAWTRNFRCIWMMEELGLPYTLVQDMPRSDAVSRVNASGKVPILLEYDSNESTEPSFTLTESMAINNYLADTYDKEGGSGRPPLIPPPCTRERAKYDETVSFILTELDAQALWIHRKHTSLKKVYGDIPQAAEKAREQFERMNPLLAQQCRPYLMGANFGAADMIYIYCLDWAMAEGWNLPESQSAYIELCRSRPAYQRANELRKASLESLKQAKM